uniref:Cinnamyl alcohol dehydrogenase 3 n=1 Tax=Haplomitrium mnioides TaxID=56921 RepID=A0AAU6NEE6_9MARC
MVNSLIGEGNCIGYAARDSSGFLSPYKFTRRPTGVDDVSFRVTHCGMCHAELVWLFNLMGDAMYPMVPGHEVIGVVTEVGSNVDRFKIGDRVGVGCFVGSCRECEYCNDGQEHVCVKHCILTYNGIDVDGTVTNGGYSSHMVTHQRYVLKIPDRLSPAEAAPLLCAGITVYSPMMRHGMNKPGKRLGVVGLGGLGHMAVKFGKAFGLEVTVLSTSESKREEAISVLGADNFVVTTKDPEVKAAVGTLDFIVDTASAEHPLDLYLSLLKTGGILSLVGICKELKFAPTSICLGLKTVSGSVTGGIKETQEMLDFCSEHSVTPMIELIDIDYANTALKRMNDKDVRYRFVIDVENTLHEL